MVVSRSMASAKRRKRVKVLEQQSLEGWRGGEKEVGSRESKENSHVELFKNVAALWDKRSSVSIVWYGVVWYGILSMG